MSDRAVLDASGAVGLLHNPELAKTIHNRFSQLISPVLYKFELGNICWKYIKFSNWSSEEAFEFLGQSLRITSFVGDLPNEKVLYYAVNNNVSYYDSTYLTLSVMAQATLISQDKKLNNAALALGIDTFF